MHKLQLITICPISVSMAECSTVSCDMVYVLANCICLVVIINVLLLVCNIALYFNMILISILGRRPCAINKLYLIFYYNNHL